MVNSRASGILLGAAVLAACAQGTVRGGSERTAEAVERRAGSSSASGGVRRERSAHAFVERRPELGIVTPRKGEPPIAALREAKLVASSCDKAAAEDVEAQLAAMRAAVDASFKDWHAAQPGCWAQMREEYRWRKEMERAGPGSMWGTEIGHAYGAGGLGLSGVGEGGGGRGEGIGLGALGSAPKAGRASGTNNQVAGVDEADIVKTDGRYVYLAANGALRIVSALAPSILSVTPIAGTAIRELFVEGDRAVVYASLGQSQKRCTYGYDCVFAGDGSSTRIVVLDVSDRSKPRVERQIDLSGSLVAARRIGSAIHTVVADGDSAAPPFAAWPVDLPICGNDEAVVKKKLAELKADNERRIRARATSFPLLTEGSSATPMCSGLLRTALSDGKSFTTIVSFDMNDAKAPPVTTSLQSRPGAVFASTNALYVSVVHRKGDQRDGRWYSYATSVNEVSEIHKFRIGAAPRDTRYVGSGTVPGHVLSQFAMDEWYGYLRVATTKGKVPDPKVESALSILAETESGALTRIGAIEKIAPGEDIRAVRFDDDRGYVVTFKKTDPLFVLDTFDPRSPKILGELKIPGFSTYLHRIDRDHLMSIGFDANDHGDFAYFDGVILQMFDVKNPTRPSLLHKEKIGTRGSSSEAATDHLAFNYFASEGLLALPMTICEGGGDGRNGDRLAFSGLLVYDVDIERGFTRIGAVDHGRKDASCGTWWSNATSHVKRSVFLDDLVYSIAPDRLKVQHMNRFGIDVADLALAP